MTRPCARFPSGRWVCAKPLLTPCETKTGSMPKHAGRTRFRLPGRCLDWGGVRFGNRLIDSRQIHVSAAPSDAFAPIQRIGGSTGWYYGNWLWTLRGWIDLLMGGVGMRRGRPDSEQLKAATRSTAGAWKPLNRDEGCALLRK